MEIQTVRPHFLPLNAKKTTDSNYVPTQADLTAFSTYCNTCHCPNDEPEDEVPKIGLGLQLRTYDRLPYAFTLRKTSKSTIINENHYIGHMQALSERLDIRFIDYVFEQEAGLHVHGIVELPYKFYFKKLRIRGWNILVKPITNEYGWINYMRKKQIVT